MLKTSRVTLAVVLALSVPVLAQAQTHAPAEPGNPTPSFHVNVVSRTALAVNYGHRGAYTRINFKGTDLMPDAQGAATGQSQRGNTKVVIELQGLQKPTSFGNEYLTYVVWAISPEGRPVNLGEILVGGNHRSKLDTTTQLQAFALIVTAEPYYAVRRPRNLVVLENEVRSDTVGKTEAVESKYELIDRGGYIPTGYKFDPVVLNANLPLEFYEARNAMRIAESAGAEKYAAPSYEKAVLQMKQADDLATRKHADKKSLVSTSRQVVQTAEDAREIAMKNIETARLDDERGAAADREAANRPRTEQESQRQVTAEIATSDAVRQRNEADRRSLGSQADAQRSANAQADAERARATAEQQQQTAQYDSDRNRAAAAGSDIATSDAVRQRNEADRRRLDAPADAQRSANAQT